MAITITEWKWEKIKFKDQKNATLMCPYCNIKVNAPSDTRIYDVDAGSIKYHIHKCPECFMPIIIGLDGKIIPQSQMLPFENVRYLPQSIEKLYAEMRRAYLNECFLSSIMVGRTLLMHVAVDKGDGVGKNFTQYIGFFETNGFIGRQNTSWVDKIRDIGNKYVHQILEATEDDAKKVILFVKQLLGTIYEMPQLAV